IRVCNQDATQDRCSNTEGYRDQSESDKEVKCMEYRSCIEFFIFHFIDAHPGYVRDERWKRRKSTGRDKAQAACSECKEECYFIAHDTTSMHSYSIRCNGGVIQFIHLFLELSMTFIPVRSAADTSCDRCRRP